MKITLDRLYNILNINNYRGKVEKVDYQFIQPLDIDKVKGDMFKKYWRTRYEG